MLVEEITKEQLEKCINIYNKIKQENLPSSLKDIKKHTTNEYERHYILQLISGVKKLNNGEKINRRSQIKAIEMYLSYRKTEIFFNTLKQEKK